MLEQGYGIMPNKILFDTAISSTSKLVFVLISSLCAERGYCWANNKYMGERLGMSERQVSRSIKELEKYLKVSIIENYKREIYLDKNVYTLRQKAVGGIDKNVYGVRQKRLGGVDKNVYHNNIMNNISNNKANNEIERRYGFRPTVLPPNVILERN